MEGGRGEGGRGEMQWEDVDTWQLHAQEASVTIVLKEQQTTAIAALIRFMTWCTVLFLALTDSGTTTGL